MHGHRILIFGLSLIGMLMDDFQLSDVVLAVALMVWLWLPYWIQLEGRLLQRIDDKRQPWS